jgi:hypothetical protein
MEGTEHTTAITKGELALKLNQDDVEDASFMKVKAIVTEAKSYDVLVGSTVLYPMGFTLDFWEETASYRPGWQAGDRRKASLPARFIRVLTGNLVDLFVFSGLVDAASPWFMENFDENAFATHLHMQVDAHVSAQNLESIKVHQPRIEVAWSTTTQLREVAELVVQRRGKNPYCHKRRRRVTARRTMVLLWTIPPSIGSHQMTGLCYWSYLEALALI